MKKYTSVMVLLAGSTAPMLLILAGVFGVLEVVAFLFAMGPYMTVEEIFANSHISFLLGLMFVLWTVALVIPSLGKNVNTRYTLDRLRIKPEIIFILHGVYNSLSYLLLWGLQIILLTSLFAFFGKSAENEVFGPQSLMFAFYRDDFLHGILPLHDWVVYLKNIMCAFTLGFAAACPFVKKSVGTFVTVGVLTIVILFIFEAGEEFIGVNWFIFIPALIIIGSIIQWEKASLYEDKIYLAKEGEYDEEA